jgi:hypothetical protein
MTGSLSRRDFLKLGVLGLGGLAFRPFGDIAISEKDENLARITIESVSVHSQPWDESTIVYQRYRDDLVNVYYKVVSPHGPEFNPVWYRVWGGYIHNARLQHVKTKLNPVAYSLPEKGQLGEITVPFTNSLLYSGQDKWNSLYRLYYESVHWITDIVQGPDQQPWYRIEDAWSKLAYIVPGEHVRLIPPEELTPISPEVPSHEKRIEVSIARQTLTAYEGDKLCGRRPSHRVLTARCQKGEIPWKTPVGTYNIFSKMPSKHMGNGDLTSDIEAYELPGVPWVCFFTKPE